MKRIWLASLLCSLVLHSGCSDQGNQKLIMANDLLDASKIDEAQKLIEEVIQEYPENAKAYNNLGFVMAARHKEDKAREFYNKALELYESQGSAQPEELANTYNNLGLLEDLAGRNEEGIKFYLKAVETDPSFVRALHNLGTVYREMDKFDEAIQWFDKALEIDPYLYQTRVFKGLCLLDAKRYPEAIKLYSDLLAEDPFKVYLQTQLALAYLLADQTAEAETVLANSLAMHPESMIVQSYAGVLMIEQGKTDEADKLSQELLEILNDPEAVKQMQPGISPDLARNVGLIRKALGDPEHAKKWLETAIKINPSDRLAREALEELESGGESSQTEPESGDEAPGQETSEEVEGSSP